MPHCDAYPPVSFLLSRTLWRALSVIWHSAAPSISALETVLAQVLVAVGAVLVVVKLTIAGAAGVGFEKAHVIWIGSHKYRLSSRSSTAALWTVTSSAESIIVGLTSIMVDKLRSKCCAVGIMFAGSPTPIECRSGQGKTCLHCMLHVIGLCLLARFALELLPNWLLWGFCKDRVLVKD